MEGQVKMIAENTARLLVSVHVQNFNSLSVMVSSFQDPRNIELIWDQMFKSTLHYGRKGLPMSVKHKSPQALDMFPLLFVMWPDNNLAPARW